MTWATRRLNNRWVGILVPVLFAVFTGVAVLAGTADVPYVSPPSAPAGTPLQNPENVLMLSKKVLEWFATIFWVAAIFFVFYAAFLYLTAGGTEQKVEKAKKQLLYAVIAIAIGTMAYGAPVFIKAFLGAGGGQPACPPGSTLPGGQCGT